MEKELYERELMGRLVSEKLTPRQFELLSGIHEVGGEGSADTLAYIKDT